MELIALSLALALGFGVAFGLIGIVLALLALYFSREILGLKERAYASVHLKTAWRHRDSRAWRAVKRVIRYDGVVRETLTTGPVIYACHPHGMLALTAAAAVLSGDLDVPGTRTVLVVHNIFWWIPFVRDVMLALGCIDRSWASIEHALAQGFSVAILPGGVHEMGPPASAAPAVLPLVQRAFTCGYAPVVVPVWLHNEDKCCWIWHSEPRLLRRFRAWSQRAIGLSAGAFFLPRVWDWPRLRASVTEPVDVACFDTAASMQTCYNQRLAPFRHRE